jgi:hypothetical protein
MDTSTSPRWTSPVNCAGTPAPSPKAFRVRWTITFPVTLVSYQVIYPVYFGVTFPCFPLGLTCLKLQVQLDLLLSLWWANLYYCQLLSCARETVSGRIWKVTKVLSACHSHSRQLLLICPTLPPIRSTPTLLSPWGRDVGRSSDIHLYRLHLFSVFPDYSLH